MKGLTSVKLALAITGIIVFGVGVRFEHPTVRWIGVGLVAAAWLTRFVTHREGN